MDWQLSAMHRSSLCPTASWLDKRSPKPRRLVNTLKSKIDGPIPKSSSGGWTNEG